MKHSTGIPYFHCLVTESAECTKGKFTMLMYVLAVILDLPMTTYISVLSLQSPDGKLIASGAIDGIINLFDLQSGRLLHTLEGMGMEHG